MKKKLFAFIVAMVLIVSLVGCSADKESKSDDNEPTATPGNESVLQVRGTWNHDVYTNNFLGLSYTLPEGWQAATDEEILTMMGLGAELLGKEDALEQSLEKQQTIYDFWVQNMTTGSNINIMFENLSLSIGGLLYSEEDYADVVVQQLQSVDSMAYVIGEYEEVTLVDKTFLKVPATAEYAGVSMEQQYYLCKEGKYMCCIVVTSAAVDAQTPEQLLEAFTKD